MTRSGKWQASRFDETNGVFILTATNVATVEVYQVAPQFPAPVLLASFVLTLPLPTLIEDGQTTVPGNVH